MNDYDLFVVDPRDLNAELDGLGAELARELGIDFVDLAYTNGCWENLPPCMLNYDLKYGSRVLCGNQRILDRIPAFAAGEFMPDDPVKLLLNRTAGLLSGITGDYLKGDLPAADAQRYLTNQMVKAWIAVGDTWLIQWSGYDSSYVRRRTRFSGLAEGAGIEPAHSARIVRAYDLKCRPDYASYDCGLPEMQELFNALEARLINRIGRLTGNAVGCLADAMSAYRQYYGAGEVELPLRHRIYADLPVLLSAVTELCTTAESWEELRKDRVARWFEVCH